VRRNFRPWICKVTPADCACQEGNTTGCIPSNDGLGAGFGPDFPHCGKQRAVGASGCVVKDSHFGTYFRGRAGLPRVFQSSLRDEFLNLVSVPSAGSAGLFSWVPTGPGATAYVGLTPDARPKSGSPSTIGLRRTHLRRSALVRFTSDTTAQVGLTSDESRRTRGARERVVEVCVGRGRARRGGRYLDGLCLAGE
jgi:hypothetical protein